MKQNIYLMRHAETDYNQKRIWQGFQINASLNRNGKKQADELAVKSAELNLELVVTGTMKRAVETASRVAEYNNVSLLAIPDLHEADYGLAEGMTFDEVRRCYPQEWDWWIRFAPEGWHKTFPQAETMMDVAERVFPVLDIVCERSFQNIALVSHAGVIGSLLSLLGVKEPKLHNCGCVLISRESDGYQFERYVF